MLQICADLAEVNETLLLFLIDGKLDQSGVATVKNERSFESTRSCGVDREHVEFVRVMSLRAIEGEDLPLTS